MTEEEENKYYIYFHINKETGLPFYVGKGKDQRAWCKSRRSQYWNNVVNKYGYTVDIIEKNLSEVEAYSKEIIWIAQLKAWNFKLCNFTIGGKGNTGLKFTNEQRNNLSKSKKGQIPWNKGKSMSEEQKKLLSKIHLERGTVPPNRKGSKMPKEAIEKISIASKNQVWTEERKRKISLKLLGNKNGRKK